MLMFSSFLDRENSKHNIPPLISYAYKLDCFFEHFVPWRFITFVQYYPCLLSHKVDNSTYYRLPDVQRLSTLIQRTQNILSMWNSSPSLLSTWQTLWLPQILRFVMLSFCCKCLNFPGQGKNPNLRISSYFHIYGWWVISG